MEPEEMYKISTCACQWLGTRRVAGSEGVLVVGLVDVEVDGEFGFGGDDFVGGHGGGDSFLLGEIDLWHAGVLASLPAVCMAPECPGKAEPVTAFSCS